MRRQHRKTHPVDCDEDVSPSNKPPVVEVVKAQTWTEVMDYRPSGDTSDGDSSENSRVGTLASMGGPPLDLQTGGPPRTPSGSTLSSPRPSTPRLSGLRKWLPTIGTSAQKHSDAKMVFEGLDGLSLMCALGETKQLRGLLTSGGLDPNARDLDGDRVPLHWAAARGELKCIAYLLKAKADTSLLDANGRTPLQLAMHNEQTAAYDLLSGGGASGASASGNTPRSGYTPRSDAAVHAPDYAPVTLPPSPAPASSPRTDAPPWASPRAVPAAESLPLVVEDVEDMSEE